MRVLCTVTTLICLTECCHAAHICIIGGGISGATVASTLGARCGNRLRTTVFEQNNRTGGRVRTLNLGEHGSVEAGASIIASANEMMGKFTRKHNLTRASPRGSSMALWDGAQFVYCTYDSTLLTIASAFFRYGMSLYRSRRHTAQLLEKYAKLYSAEPKNSVGELLESVGLYDYTQRGFEALLGDLSATYKDEIAAAIVRVNYNEEWYNMNGLAGSVALAGSGDSLWHVGEGNEELIHRVLKSSGAEVQLNAKVSSVVLNSPGYSVQVEEEEPVICDGVVLAAPFETSDIGLPESIASVLDVGRKFSRLHVTFVRGTLNSETFGANPPGSILTTRDVDDVFNSVSEVAKGVFKVFSKQKLDNPAMGRIFERHQELAYYDWLAYPRFTKKERFAPFNAHENGAFWYVNTLESAGSAMEMSAVAASNVAGLIVNKFTVQCPVKTIATTQDEMKEDL